MSGRSSPADTIHEYLRERENFVMESVAPYPQLTNPQPQEEELFLTPGPSPNQAVAIPYADANYPSPVPQVQYYPEFSPSQGMDQPPLHSLQVPVHPGYTDTPASPCGEDDSAFYSSSPHSSASYTTSPAGSPMPCPATSQPFYPNCTLPDPMTTMCEHPASSLPLTCSSIPPFEDLTKPVYAASQMGFYPAIQNTSAWGIPPCDETFMLPDNSCNLPRTTSHNSVLTNAEHHIQYIDTNSPSHTLDFYPPTPESPESRQHCHSIHDCPNLNQQYEFASPHHIIQGMPFATCPSPKIPIKPGRGRIQRKAPKPPVQVDDSEIKDIPTSAQLWEFTLRVLKKPKYSYMVSWENKKDGLFRFGDAQAFAALWGKHRNRPSMTYDKVARALRYYYKRDILNQVGGRLTYKFSKRLGKLYASE